VIVVTTHVPEIHVRRLHVNVWLVAVVGLAAALVALGTWVLVDRYAGGGGATQDATTLIDDFNAAITAGDADAVAALITSDFETWTTGSDLYTADEFLARATSPLGAERIAPVTVEGDFATTYVTVSAVANPLVAVYQLEDGRIFRLWGFELGSTPPFDNAVLP
jgi:ketosteroid isomerase-like protein